MGQNTPFEVYPKNTGRFGVRFSDKFIKIYGPSVQDSIDSLTADNAEAIAGIYVRDACSMKPLPKQQPAPPATDSQLSFF